MHLLVALVLAVAPARPRLAFIELAPGADVPRQVAQAAGEQLVVALSETGKFDVITVGRRVSLQPAGESSLPQAAREAIAACKRWAGGADAGAQRRAQRVLRVGALQEGRGRLTRS